MMMAPRLNKFVLTSHITFSVGWLGAVAVFLVLAITGLNSRDDQLVRAAFLAMELSSWFIIVPFCIASLLTGIVQALGSK
jgi:ABC-type multidrug transport system permease subunit